jgi:hypothetical protein
MMSLVLVYLLSPCLLFSIDRHLRHKNLVQLVGLVFVGPTVHSIVMELMGKVRYLLNIITYFLISMDPYHNWNYDDIHCINLITGFTAKVPHLKGTLGCNAGRTVAFRKVLIFASTCNL